MPWRIVSYRVVPCCAVSYRAVPWLVVSYQMISGWFGTGQPYITNFPLGSTESHHSPRAPRTVQQDRIEFEVGFIRFCVAKQT